MYAIVKFDNADMPEVVNVPNDEFVDHLRTMANVSWIQVIGISGYAQDIYPLTALKPVTPEPVIKEVIRPCLKCLTDPRIFSKVMNAIRSQLKIVAIKEYRNATKCGLLEAKLVVEAVINGEAYKNWGSLGDYTDRYQDDEPPF
jgi:ribosomal protein L7/L12